MKRLRSGRETDNVLAPYDNVFFTSYQNFKDLPAYFDESLLRKYYYNG